MAAESLGALGVSGDTIRQRIEGIVGRGGDSPTGYIPFTPRAKKAMFECALRETMRLGHTYIGTEHLLLGLIREGHGLAAEVLVNLGADHMKVKHEVHRRLASRPDAGRSLADLAEENRRLRSEVARLRSLLHRHGIEPGEDPPAAAEAAP